MLYLTSYFSWQWKIQIERAKRYKRCTLIRYTFIFIRLPGCSNGLMDIRESL